MEQIIVNQHLGAELRSWQVLSADKRDLDSFFPSLPGDSNALMEASQ